MFLSIACFGCDTTRYVLLADVAAIGSTAFGAFILYFGWRFFHLARNSPFFWLLPMSRGRFLRVLFGHEFEGKRMATEGEGNR